MQLQKMITAFTTAMINLATTATILLIVIAAITTALPAMITSLAMTAARSSSDLSPTLVHYSTQ
jgi:hypothetical protein